MLLIIKHNSHSFLPLFLSLSLASVYPHSSATHIHIILFPLPVLPHRCLLPSFTCIFSFPSFSSVHDFYSSFIFFLLFTLPQSTCPTLLLPIFFVSPFPYPLLSLLFSLIYAFPLSFYLTLFPTFSTSSAARALPSPTSLSLRSSSYHSISSPSQPSNVSHLPTPPLFRPSHFLTHPAGPRKCVLLSDSPSPPRLLCF